MKSFSWAEGYDHGAFQTHAGQNLTREYITVPRWHTQKSVVSLLADTEALMCINKTTFCLNHILVLLSTGKPALCIPCTSGNKGSSRRTIRVAGLNGRVLICGCKRIDSIQRCRPGARCAGFTPIVLNDNTGEDGAAYRLPGFTTNMKKRRKWWGKRKR